MNDDQPKTELLIRAHRKRKGMTLKQLAEAIGTTPQTVQRVETENMTVSLVWLDKIAAALNIPAHALLGSNAGRIATTPDELFIEAMLEELGRSRYNMPANAQAMARIAKAFGELSDALLDWQIGVAKIEKVERAAATMAALVMRIALDGDSTLAKQLKKRDAVTTNHEEAAA